MSGLWKSARRWLPGVIISFAAIAAILYFVDLHQFIEAIRSANYWLLAAAFSISLIWLIVRGAVWRTLLQDKASYRDAFLTICEGYLLNNFLPFRLGEIGRAFLLGRKTDLGFMGVLPSIIIERILDLAYAAMILLSAVPFVVRASSAGSIALVIGVVVLFGLVFLYVLARNRDWAMRLFDRMSASRPVLKQRGGAFLNSLFMGLSILTNGWLFLRVLLWMTLNWSIAIFQFYVLLLAFFPQAQVLWSLFGLGAVAFGNAVPSLPGAVGTFEGAMGAAISLLSNDQSTSLAVALTAHLINYFWTGIIGLYALLNEGETVMGIYHQLRKKQEDQQS